jgi:hypothetical protein
MKSKILAVLLLLSILTNIYLIQVQPSSKDLLEMKDKINQLEITNSQMRIVESRGECIPAISIAG